ncbi:hypothetical protein FRC03_002988 [Tulasnella sp. 419]|nr:hypothetical protein FRC03_002988 [Tulasnella sp. 419]
MDAYIDSLGIEITTEALFDALRYSEGFFQDNVSWILMSEQYSIPAGRVLSLNGRVLRLILSLTATLHSASSGPPGPSNNGKAQQASGTTNVQTPYTPSLGTSIDAPIDIDSIPDEYLQKPQSQVRLATNGKGGSWRPTQRTESPPQSSTNKRRSRVVNQLRAVSYYEDHLYDTASTPASACSLPSSSSSTDSPPPQTPSSSEEEVSIRVEEDDDRESALLKLAGSRGKRYSPAFGQKAPIFQTELNGAPVKGTGARYSWYTQEAHQEALAMSKPKVNAAASPSAEKRSLDQKATKKRKATAKPKKAKALPPNNGKSASKVVKATSTTPVAPIRSKPILQLLPNPYQGLALPLLPMMSAPVPATSTNHSLANGTEIHQEKWETMSQPLDDSEDLFGEDENHEETAVAHKTCLKRSREDDDEDYNTIINKKSRNA